MVNEAPERMAEFSNWLESRQFAWPKNLWVGTSITTQATTTRIKSLLKVGNERTIHFLSVEPQIEEIDLANWLPKLDWVIQGGESGRKARPFEIAWAKALLLQCEEHGIPYFLKQLGSAVHDRGERITFEDGHAGEWSEWPEFLRARKFPAVYHGDD